jgi:hypothetical protein
MFHTLEWSAVLQFVFALRLSEISALVSAAVQLGKAGTQYQLRQMASFFFV